MSSAQTTTTELAIAFGLLDLEPNLADRAKINGLFKGSLSPQVFEEFLIEFYRNQPLYRRFYSIGVEMRICYPPFEILDFVQWVGGVQQSQSVVIPKDIFAANTPVSIKAASNIIYNRSAHKLFVGLPSGGLSPARSNNWYAETALDDYQELYTFARNAVAPHLPEDVLMFHRRGKVTKEQREQFAEMIKQMSGELARGFEERYLALCRRVATISADKFNESLALTLGSTRNAIEGKLLETFFRVGDTPYIVCGSNKGDDFAIEVPDMTYLRRMWRVRRLVAIPDLLAGQSEVRFSFVMQNRSTGQEYDARFWAEIRWTHGKFVVNPEAKLYKDFKWTDVPFFTQLYTPGRVRKIGSIGRGGFGTVYAATIGKSRQIVAVKELRIAHLRREGKLEEATERFKQEVTLQAQVNHPNIMPVLDRDLEAVSPWFATELAVTTLTSILSELPEDRDRINQIFSQLLRGLAHAHSNGLIHRDIKPDNVFIFDNDLAKLGDFGLVKPISRTDQKLFDTHTSDHSFGSVPYTAPEQLESFKKANHLSDIYSLGVTLYAMLLGKESPTTLMINSIESPYCEFIKRCIEQRPEDRFQTVDEAIRSFTDTITGED
jgi:tRNA A-37 threonylcarbamoyl transferase component Bud32